jgi:hypothetical protein
LPRAIALECASLVDTSPLGTERLIGWHIRLVLTSFRRSPGELASQRGGYSCGNLVLNGKNIRQFPVVAFRPEVISVSGVDKLRGHANAIFGLADAAFKHRTHPPRLGNLGDVLLLAAEGEGGNECRSEL